MPPLSKRSSNKLIVGIVLVIITFITASPVYSADYATLREKASPDGGDIVMVDGPFYVGGNAYYTLDFMLMSKSKKTLVYNERMKEVKGRTARKVLAVRDMKYILIAEPLFYAPGNHELIIKAGEYDIQNTRNIADISDLTPDEREKLEEYFRHYRQLMKDVAEVSRITNEILYPQGSLEIKNDWSSFAYEMSVDDSKMGYYSYERFEKLISAYEKTVEDYRKMVGEIRAFSDMRGFEGQEITDEMLRNLSEHGDMLESKVGVRGELIYALGRPSLCGPSFILLLSMLPVALLRFRRCLPPAIALILTLTILSIAWSAEEMIPTPDELFSQVVDIEDVPIYIDTQKGAKIDTQTARSLLKSSYYFPYILNGEIVTVRGPYYYHGDPWYLFEISKDGVPSGIVLVDALNFAVVRNQKMAFQISKAARVAATLEKDPIYTSKSASEVRQYLSNKHAQFGSEGPMKVFIEQEISNLENGEILERQLIEKPDFETLVELNKNLLQGFIILGNIERITSKEEAADLTSGFTVNIPRIEAIVTISSGPTAEEYYMAKKSRHVRRSLTKLPTLKSFAEAGEPPSKGYFLSYYLVKDMIKDNVLVYREETGRSKFVEEYLGRWREEG
jgi:hypothetical protein